MSNLGMKITGSDMEVGFLASTREEFDSFLDRLRLMADTVWTAEKSTQSLSSGVGSPEEPIPLPTDLGVDYAAIKKNAQRQAKWREEQGLR